MLRSCYLQKLWDFPYLVSPESWGNGFTHRPQTHSRFLFRPLDPYSFRGATAISVRNPGSGLCPVRRSEGPGHGPGLCTLTRPTGMPEQVKEHSTPRGHRLGIPGWTRRAPACPPRERGKPAPNHCSEGPPGVLQHHNRGTPASNLRRMGNARSRPRCWPGSSQGGGVSAETVSGSLLTPSPPPSSIPAMWEHCPVQGTSWMT